MHDEPLSASWFMDGEASNWSLPGNEQPSVKRPVGRPTLYSIELAGEICARLGNDEKLHDICKDEHMPHPATVYVWLARHAEFREIYEAALLAKFDKRAEELIAIADDASGDFETVTDADGIPTVRENKESLGRTDRRLATRMWVMAKELPRKYGPPAAPAAASAATDEVPQIAPPQYPSLTDVLRANSPTAALALVK